ncbi:ABC transporter substrate-binding protein [Intestinimonas butyriciproducens]|uniref:ABC transporter substrate-binding protein n=1 Tax=Intestinimonas butyriciproducens TaxID=1297617 RepID=UPI001957CEAB|nr:sugar ABC transporter substrate-binding protein [Intestinimonas butyriciproducens]MBM6977452.1 extracellular solute-binding protein [Intestinimonas butyriciproducens]
MKKVLSLTLAATLAISLLAGCAGGDTVESANPSAAAGGETTGELSGEITFWHSFTQGARMEAIQAAADQFMADNPGVTINIETMAWGDFNTKWNAGITTGDLPDISTAQNTGEVVEMLNADVLAPMDSTIDAIGRDLFSANALADMSMDDTTYGIPYYSHAQVMWYRTDLLEANNLEVPTTWDEFYEAAVALTRDGVYGCAFSCSPNDLLCTRYLNYYVRSGGGSLLNDDLTANLTSDLAIDGINFWLEVYKNCSPAETINYTVNDHATLYYQGTTAFDFNSGFMISGVESNRPDLLEYVSCAPLPLMAEGDPYYSAEATHIPLVTWKNSEHPEICQAFIEYLYQEDNYLDFLAAVPVGMLPSIKGIDQNETYLSNPIVRQFSDEAAVITKAVEEGTAIGFEHGPSAQAGLLTSQGVIEEMFQDIITNGTDVETAAKAAEDKLNEIFATMVA